MRRFAGIVLSCEHASPHVPLALRAAFRGQAAVLASHRGWDPGALPLAERLAEALHAPLIAASVSRLVIDHNRSLTHPALHGITVRTLPASQRRALIADYYRPFRAAVLRALRQASRGGRPVLHLSVHSFTPVLAGRRRLADLGLLYDPARRGEAQLCAAWRRALVDDGVGWRVRRNYPYAGWTDGHATALRAELPARAYVGVEIEMSQRFAGSRRQLDAVAAWLLRGLQPLL